MRTRAKVTLVLAIALAGVASSSSGCSSSGRAKGPDAGGATGQIPIVTASGDVPTSMTWLRPTAAAA